MQGSGKVSSCLRTNDKMSGITIGKPGQADVHRSVPDLTGLNEAQRRAVTHGEGPLLLLAGPGSGKTLTITNRILYLLANGTAPEKLLVITFTKEAALSMQRRFQEKCGSTVYPVNFGTFHSCFYHILQKSGAVGAKKIIKNSDKINLLIPLLKQYADPNKATPDSDSLKEDAAQLLSAISFYKNTLKYDGAVKKIPSLWQPHFEAIMAAYEDRVRGEGLIDFDEMLSGCARLLKEDAEIRSYWQGRFSHILMDEFQDINPVQYSIIKLLTKAPYNIFAVGDDDQAIYGFRGAEPDCLRRFEQEFRAERMLLDINYRSSGEIVRASLAVIGENRNRFDKKLRAAQEAGSRYQEGGSCLQRSGSCFQEGDGCLQRSGGSLAQNFGTQLQKGAHMPEGTVCRSVVCEGFVDREAQYRHMLEALQHVFGKKESCAVLFRTNSYMQGFAARLGREGIPYEIKDTAVSIYEHFIVKDMVAYLVVACGNARREDFLRIVNRPSRYVSREAVAECGVDMAKLRAYYEKGSSLSPARRADVIHGLAALERQLKNMGRLPLHLAVDFCLKAAGYERYLKEKAAGTEDKWQEWQELLEWLRGEAAQYPDLKEWLAAQEAYNRELARGTAQKKQIVKKQDYVIRTDRAERGGYVRGAGNGESVYNTEKPVQLMTVHAAKGLEFDRVWIPDCNEKIYPHGSLPDAATVEEERRIFYVAMTRAKKNLELLYLTGTRERPRQPSRFLNPLFHGGDLINPG